MRDLETISIALTAAETGHLVLSTLHTIGSAKTIDRIIDVFPPHQQGQIRTQLSTVLEGIISQQLLPKADGKGRILATETMVWTPAIANLIRESRTHQIDTCIQTGSQFGMYSMDSCISDLYKQELIDYDTACQYAVDLDNLRKLFLGKFKKIVFWIKCIKIYIDVHIQGTDKDINGLYCILLNEYYMRVLATEILPYSFRLFTLLFLLAHCSVSNIKGM